MEIGWYIRALNSTIGSLMPKLILLIKESSISIFLNGRILHINDQKIRLNVFILISKIDSFEDIL